VIVQLPSSGLLYLFFGQKPSHKVLITIIDIEMQEVMTTISMDTNIYGMAVRGRTIYYCAGSKGIKMLNLRDKSISNIINSDMLGVYYVATSGILFYLYLSGLIPLLLC
jgi:hypothetical protein